MMADPLEIKNRFREFYEHLYKSESPVPSGEQDTFFDHLQFQTLTDEVLPIEFYKT